MALHADFVSWIQTQINFGLRLRLRLLYLVELNEDGLHAQVLVELDLDVRVAVRPCVACEESATATHKTNNGSEGVKCGSVDS